MCSTDLASLVDQSLVRVEDHDDEHRYVMLEPIREFAAERLQLRGEAERCVDGTLARTQTWSSGPPGSWRAATSGDGSTGWSVTTTTSGLRWSRPSRPATPPSRSDWWRVPGGSGRSGATCARRGREIGAVVAQPWSADDPRMRARLLEAAGGIEYWHGSSDTATAFYDEALAIARDLGDPRLISNALYNGSAARFVGGRPTPEALEMLQESLELARRAGDRHGEANAMWALGTYHYFAGDYAAALPYHEQSHAIFPETGDVTMEAWSDHQIGIVLVKLGQIDASVGCPVRGAAPVPRGG